MKKIIRHMNVWLSVLLVTLLIAGCSQAASTSSSATVSKASSAAASSQEEVKREIIDVVISTPYMDNETMEVYANPENDPIIKYIGDLFGMNIKVWTGNPGEYHTKLQLQFSTGQGPDACGLLTWDGGDTLYRDLLEQDALLDIGALVFANPDKYPAIAKIFEDDFYKALNMRFNQDTEKFVSLYELSSAPATRGSPVFYMPYLNEVGVTELPKTVDEFVEVLRKLKAGDPDKNGKNGDVIPWSPNTYKGASINNLNDGFGQIFFETEGSYMSGIVPDYETGTTYKSYFEDPSHVEIFKKIAQYYKEGLFDPEFLTVEAYTNWDQQKNGRAAITTAVLPHTNRGSQYTALFDTIKSGEVFPNITVDQLQMLPNALVGSKGQAVTTRGVPMSTAIINIIPKNGANAERMLELYNYLYSDEGQKTIWFGIPDEHYKLNDKGEPELIGDAFEKVCRQYCPKDTRISWDPFLIVTDVSRGFAQYERDGWSKGAQNVQPLETLRMGITPQLEYAINTSKHWYDSYYKPLPAYFSTVSLATEFRDKLTAINDIALKYYAGFMTGEIDVEKNYDKYVAEIKSAGLDELVAEHNRLLDEAKKNFS